MIRNLVKQKKKFETPIAAQFSQKGSNIKEKGMQNKSFHNKMTQASFPRQQSFRPTQSYNRSFTPQNNGNSSSGFSQQSNSNSASQLPSRVLGF